MLKEDILPIIMELASNKTITELNISGHMVGNSLGMFLGKALTTNTTLKTILWDDNQTTLSGFMKVVNGLRTNATLTRMVTPSNDVSTAFQSNPKDLKELSKIGGIMQNFLYRNIQLTPTTTKAVVNIEGGFRGQEKKNLKTLNRTPDYERLLEKVLQDKEMIMFFREFLHKSHNNENLSFWLEAANFQKSPEEDVPKLASELYSKYFTSETTYEVNIDAKLKKDLDASMSSPSRNMFNEIQKSVWGLMAFDCLPKFLQSDVYEKFKAGKRLRASTEGGSRTNIHSPYSQRSNTKAFISVFHKQGQPKIDT